MELLGVKQIFAKIKRYLKLYLLSVKYAAQVDLMYWQNFLTSILVEFFYQGAFFAFFAVIMTKTKTISGWGVGEMTVLLGIDTITSELLTGILIVWNSRELPMKIWSGELDRLLMRPIHPLFNLTLGRPYFPSFVSSLVGFFLIYWGVSYLGIQLTAWAIIGSVLFFILGFILVYCIIVDFSLLTFFFQDTVTLPQIGERIVYSYTSRPHSIFNGFLKFIFFFLFPVVYVSSFSTQTLIKGPNLLWLVVVALLVAGFVLFTRFIWQKAISSYSSVSS